MSGYTDARQSTSTVHAAWLRLVHWLNAIAVIALASSGWAIYNAAPLYDVEMPAWAALGGHLTEALRWHFAFMWLLAATSAVLIAVRVTAGAGGPRLLPVSAAGVVAVVSQVVRLRLVHRDGEYNPVQRLMYVGLYLLLLLAVASGLALWKPVQLGVLTDLMGGYESARRVHFWTMVGICVFVTVHLLMVVLTPRTLLSMLLGARAVALGAGR